MGDQNGGNGTLSLFVDDTVDRDQNVAVVDVLQLVVCRQRISPGQAASCRVALSGPSGQLRGPGNSSQQGGAQLAAAEPIPAPAPQAVGEPRARGRRLPPDWINLWGATASGTHAVLSHLLALRRTGLAQAETAAIDGVVDLLLQVLQVAEAFSTVVTFPPRDRRQKKV